MKTKYSFEFMELDDGLVAVPVGNNNEQFHGVIKINESAAAILKLLANDITEEEVVNNIVKEYSGEEEKITSYVHDFIEKLISEGVLEE